MRVRANGVGSGMQAPCRSGYWRRDENCRPCGPVLKYRCPRWSSHLPPASQQPRRRDAAAYLARHRACHAPAAAMPCSSYAAARALPLDRTCGASRQDAAPPSSKTDGALRQLRCIIAAAAVQVRVGGWSGQARAGGRAGGGTKTAGQRGRRGAPRPESKGTDVPYQLRRTIAPPPQRGTQLRPGGKRRQHENRRVARAQGARRALKARALMRCASCAAASRQQRAGGTHACTRTLARPRPHLQLHTYACTRIAYTNTDLSPSLQFLNGEFWVCAM